MGQKISALRRKVRAFKADTQFCKIDRSVSRITSSENEGAMLPSNVVESVHPGIIRTSSQTSHPIRDSKIDTMPKCLLKLPTELLLEIAEYLPPSSYMSLSYSCRRIRNGMGASIEYVLGNKIPIGRQLATALLVEVRNVRSLERLEWRRMLDRDKKVPSPKTFCSGCLITHDRSLFSIRSLTQPDTKRYCLGSAGKVWICPHKSFDYNQLLEFVGKPRDSYSCEGRSVSMYGEFYDTCSFGSMSSGYFVTYWPIVKMPQHGLPSNQEVEEALRLLRAPMCPHLRLNDKCVASAYMNDCASLQERPDFRSLMISSERVLCTFCGISIQFVRRRFVGPETLRLVIFRRLECLKESVPWSCTDPGWICQVADPDDIEEYETAWHAANVECWRRNRDYLAIYP